MAATSFYRIVVVVVVVPFSRGRDAGNQRGGRRRLCLPNPIRERDAFSSSCAMNQDFLEYFPEYQIPASLSYTGWPVELPRVVGSPSTGIFFCRSSGRAFNRYLAGAPICREYRRAIFSGRFLREIRLTDWLASVRRIFTTFRYECIVAHLISLITQAAKCAEFGSSFLSRRWIKFN